MMNEDLLEQAHKALSEVMKGTSTPGDTERNFQKLLELVSEVLQRTDARAILTESKMSALKQPKETPSVGIR